MSIATRLEAIEQHLTDDYSVLTLAGADLTNVDKNIVNLKPTWKERLLYFMNNGTDTVWNNWEKVNGSGTSLTLNNTEYAPMKLEYLGNTSQDSTTGKNLLENELTSTTSGPITITRNNDGTLTINGTANTNVSFVINSGVVLSAGKYYFSGLDGVTTDQAYINFSGIINVYDGEVSSTLSEEKTTIVRLYIRNGASFTNKVIKPMIATTSGEYEPYTNGPSPNPSYPQDVHVVSGDNTVTVKNGDNTQSQSYLISLGNTELCKIGTYQDLIFKNIPSSTHYDNTLDEGDWYLKKEIGKVVFDGTQQSSTFNYNTNLGTTDYSCFFWQDGSIMKAPDDNTICVLSNKFIGTPSNERTSNNPNCWLNHLTAGNLGFHVSNTITTTSGLITWFSTNISTFYYVLSTPTYTKITDSTLLGQLEAIKRSYEEQTNISQTNDDLPFELSVSALEVM